MQDLYQIPSLYIRDVENKGRGLFCARNIHAGDCIENAAAVFFDFAQAGKVDKTCFYNFYFSLSYLSDNQALQIGIEPDKKEKAGAVILGAASIANHSEKPNAQVMFAISDGRLYGRLEALLDIACDQEICISYGQLWFEAA